MRRVTMERMQYSQEGFEMAQAADAMQPRPVPLHVTPEARKRLTPFRERVFRELYDAAIADGGADIMRIAEVIWWDSDVDPEWEPRLLLSLWVDGSHGDAEVVASRMDARMGSLWESLTEAERTDRVRWISYGASPYSMIENSRAALENTRAAS